MRNYSAIIGSVLTMVFLLGLQIGPLVAQEDVVEKTADGVVTEPAAQPEPCTEANTEQKTEQKTETSTDSETGDSLSTEPKCEYEFTNEHSVAYTEVKSQDETGTCWCFATASFIESELIRREKGKHNLSEMFIVKNIYRDKALNFVLRQGTANFSEGALAHDFINAAHRYGLMPEEVFTGRDEGEEEHDHGEMEAVMLGFLQAVAERKKLSNKWQIACDKILDTYLGESPDRFVYRDRSFSPLEFSKSLEFRGHDYVNLTSYTHHPFYEPFILEIPDNFSNGSFQNLPIDDLIEVIDTAIKSGFSVAWDGDVSEEGFSSKQGIAVLPKDEKREDVFTVPGEELDVDQEMRQKSFMTFATTDDHMMHLVGISRDIDGNKYYMVKNSWGEVGPYKGIIHMSESFVRLKTVAILVHKEAIPPRLLRD